MRRSGELVQWNDGRGFGFIRDNDAERYFVHISEIRKTETRPVQGLRVSFDPGVAGDGRPIARAVVLLGVAPVMRDTARPTPQRVAPPRLGSLLRLVAAALIVIAAVAATQQGLAPSWVLLGYLMLGAVSIVLYWIDKRAAEAGRWRITEKSLHFADLIGGIAGGLTAQALLRHKVRKTEFAVSSWLIATIHLLGLVLLTLGVWDFPAWAWG